MIKGSLATQPEASRRAARIIQNVPLAERRHFISALENYAKISDLPALYQEWFKDGYPA